MGFKNRSFDQPIYDEQQQEARRVIIISCEGRNTEPEYFNCIKTKLGEYISALVEVEVIEKEDNNSEPKDVIANLKRHVEDKYDHQGGHDQFWMVCDREQRSNRKQALLDIFPQCQQQGYFVALTNPLFEFWLLLHVVDIEDYDPQILLENRKHKVRSKRRYIDKTLSEMLEGGFNKEKGRFNQNIVSLENVERALEQEQLFATEPGEIVDNLGSNIGELVCSMLGKPWQAK